MLAISTNSRQNRVSMEADALTTVLNFDNRHVLFVWSYIEFHKWDLGLSQPRNLCLQPWKLNNTPRVIRHLKPLYENDRFPAVLQYCVHWRVFLALVHILKRSFRNRVKKTLRSRSDRFWDKCIAVFLMLECSLVYSQWSLFIVFVFATGCDVNEKEIEFNGCETACKGKEISSFVFGWTVQCKTQTTDCRPEMKCRLKARV